MSTSDFAQSQPDVDWQEAFEVLLKAHDGLKETLCQCEARCADLMKAHHDMREQYDSERKQFLELLDDYRTRTVSHSQSVDVNMARLAQRARLEGNLQKFQTFSLSHPHPEEWISEVRTYVTSYFEDDKEAVIFVLGLLERDVKTALKVRTQLDSVDSLTLMSELEALFSQSTSTELFIRFHLRVQGKDEALKDYAVSLMELAVKLRVKDSLSTEETESKLKHQFAAGVHLPQLRRELKRLNAEQSDLTFMQVLQKAEDWLTEVNDKKQSSSACHKCSAESTNTQRLEAEANAQFAYKSRVDKLEEYLSKQGDLIGQLVQQVYHLSSERTESSKTKIPKHSERHCTFCGNRGHFAKYCFRRRKAKRKQGQSSTAPSTFGLHVELNQLEAIARPCAKVSAEPQQESTDASGLVRTLSQHKEAETQTSPFDSERLSFHSTGALVNPSMLLETPKGYSSREETETCSSSSSSDCVSGCRHLRSRSGRSGDSHDWRQSKLSRASPYASQVKRVNPASTPAASPVVNSTAEPSSKSSVVYTGDFPERRLRESPQSVRSRAPVKVLSAGKEDSDSSLADDSSLDESSDWMQRSARSKKHKPSSHNNLPTSVSAVTSSQVKRNMCGVQ